MSVSCGERRRGLVRCGFGLGAWWWKWHAHRWVPFFRREVLRER